MREATVIAPVQRGIGISERYLSLDVLRGLTICLMIIVNTPGSWGHIYAPFAHADWHGFTPTDLVFPTFLFVVGNAMSFSMKNSMQIGGGFFLRKVLKRTLMIFLIGLFLNAFPFVDINAAGDYVLINLSELRIMGVLQRIALCYLLASLIIYYFGKKGLIIYSLLALLGYWGILWFLGDPEAPYSMLGNAGHHLDLIIIGPQNLYGGEGVPFDPEGLLSTLPAVVNVLMGYMAGIFIQKWGNNLKTIKVLLIVGLIFIGLSLVWDLGFPINKKIWTSSFVLLTVGLDLILIGILMLVIEVWLLKKWTYFFEVFGRNPLVLYMLSLMLISLFWAIPVGGDTLNQWLYQNLFLSWLPDKSASLGFALTYMILIWLIGWWMDRKKVYVKV
ncbi:acyltransferase family protein [Pararhodonellum marinum]|uniref:acyltransferase family protein n=1 Tax=Pararhodonellum marinum TaxID=2755358 RepID=UPI00188EBD64|nr:DUF5009 domain-containing protein [Pararhodonellum marinum]